MVCPYDRDKYDESNPYKMLYPQQEEIKIPTIQYNPFNDEWRYIEPDKQLQYNPFENTWEWEE